MPGRRQPSSLRPRIVSKPSLRSTTRCNASKEVFINGINKENNFNSCGKKRPPRRPYTDYDDWAILDHIITNGLADKVRSHATWTHLEAAGVTLHSAESMRSRFMHSIVHHLGEVLCFTSEGKSKYNNADLVNRLSQILVNESMGPQTSNISCKKESPNVLSDLSYFTSDNSVHDGDPNNFTPINPPHPHEPFRLVDYEDTQSQQTIVNASSNELCNIEAENTPPTERSHRSTRLNRRLSLSLNNGFTRFKSLSFRPQRISTMILRSAVNKADEIIQVDHPDTPEGSKSFQALSKTPKPSKKQSTKSVNASDDGSVTIFGRRNKGSQANTRSKGAESAVQTRILRSSVGSKCCPIEVDFGSAPAKQSATSDTVQGGSKRLPRGEISSVDLDSDCSPFTELSKRSSKVSAAKSSSLEIIPDTNPETCLNNSETILKEGGHSPNETNINLQKFLFLESRPKCDMHDTLCRVVQFTRQLDAFAHLRRLSATDAALLLHVTSGDLKAADHVATEANPSADGPPLWFPSDDALLLSVSCADLNEVYRKFGSKEVSRRLAYLADQSLVSSFAS